MSLLVYAYRIDEEGRRIDLGETRSAGFESWRTTVWGSKAGRALGLRILSDLDRRDIDADGEELAHLEAEVRLLEAHLRELVDAVVKEGIQIGNWDPYDAIAARLANIVAAIAEARAIPGAAVYIG